MLTINDFVQKYNLKNKAMSNIKFRKVLTSIGLDNVKIYLRHGPFSSDIVFVNSHPSKGSHWVCYVIEIYFDSYGCSSPKKLSKFNIKRNGYCLYSEYRVQKNDSFCSSFCLYILYETKVIGFVFKSAVLNLYYQLL